MRTILKYVRPLTGRVAVGMLIKLIGTASELIHVMKDQLFNIKKVEAIDFVGYSKEHKAYVLGDIAVRDGELVHANEEAAHADLLAQRIVQLGGSPDFAPSTLLSRSHAQYDESSDLQDMVRANLVAERIAVEAYRQMIQLIGDKDPTTRRMLEGILADEEEHADELKDWLHR